MLNSPYLQQFPISTPIASTTNKLSMRRKGHRTSTDHQVAFKDHDGNPAIMAWRAPIAQRLPTLSVWVIYMVNPETPLDFDATKFRHGFDGDYDPYLGQPFRFEFFFLPDATSEECIAHYRKEIASRGTVWHQIRQVRAATKDRRVARRVTYRRERAAMKEEQTRRREAAEDPASKTSHDEFEEFTDYSSEGYNSSDRSLFHEDDTEPHPTGPNEQKLPGLPWLKDDELNGYRQWFLMCTDEQVKWDPAGPGYNKQALNLRVVEFDPVPIEYEEGEVVRWDPMDHPVRIRQGPDLRFTCWQRERCRDYWAMQAMEAMEAEDIGWETW